MLGQSLSHSTCLIDFTIINYNNGYTLRHCDRVHTASMFSSSRFLLFFFFCLYLLTLRDRFYCCEQCMHCSYTVYILFTYLKNIKNGSHDTIYTFKNYFATVFLVFSFQFSATISSIQTDPLASCGKKK